ncbi:Ubiquitin carboxyl-terminal hydrolase 3 [Paraconiothyrium brasiliense]|uniref:Ubiquitin carboxyl-terminal hydrolase 3 n=1 Tax=Paraconiothyrium brasiliense TaxID=300254 RepID=A0ABR3S5A1_9PLEO
MTDKLLQTILNRQSDIMRSMNLQQADLATFVSMQNNKRDGSLINKMQETLNAIQDLKISITTSKSGKALDHSSSQPSAALSLSNVMPGPSLPRSSTPRGLIRDHGRHTCYMNSILQALAAVDPYELERESGVPVGMQPQMNRNRTDSDYYETSIYRLENYELNLMWEFLHLLKLLRSKGLSAAVPPFAFQFTFARLSGLSDYKGREEQDTAEYFCALLNHLGDDSSYGRVLRRLFRIHTSEIVKCSNFPEEKEVSDPSWYMSLKPFPRLQTTTVVDVIDKPTQAQAISVNRLFEYNAKYYDGCPYDSEGCKHQKTLRFLEPLPDFLMLKFLRHEVIKGKTDWDSSNKLAYKVLFDEQACTIDLSQYVGADGSEENQHVYKLRTVIYHSGSTYATGHYFAVSRTDEGGSNNWWQCNDSSVSKVSTGPYPVGDLKYSQAYMALYEKVQPDDSTSKFQKQRTEHEKEQDMKKEDNEEQGEKQEQEQEQEHHRGEIQPKEVYDQW